VLWFGTPAASRVVLLAAGIATMVLSVFLTQSRGGMMGLSFAIVATAVLIWRRYSRSSRVAIVGLLATLLVGVTLWAGVDQTLQRFGEAANHSYIGRTAPWADAWDLWRRYPLAGTGINTYNGAMFFYQQYLTEVHFNAAHNDYLQLLAEGGALVGLPILAAIAALMVTAARRFREEPSLSTFWIRAGATIGLLSIAIQELGDFSLQIPGNAVLFAVLCAIVIHRTPERRRA
jgi:O-antigen ligase